MTIINPNSISGITSITLPSGGDNVLTIHTNDGVERFRIDSSGNVKVGSAATISPDGDLFVTGVTTTGGHFAGSGANLTNLPAANITGTLPAISAANLTNIPAANVTGTLPAISGANLTNLPAANITGTLPAIDGSALTGIGGTDFIHAEQISVSGVTTSQAFIPSEGQLSHRNLVINGAFQVAQRATSSTSNGYTTVDRIKVYYSGTDENPTFSQADVASGTTPYTLGFRKCFKITNGNQTSVSAGDYIYFRHIIESQNVATSGWNYKNSSSKVTLSFWIKSSVAQDFKGYLRATATSGANGSRQQYSFATGSLSANTWTKITKTIPGHANLEFDLDNGSGLDINLSAYFGTNYSSSSTTENAWADYASGDRVLDYSADTWYTTDDATLEITGLQLEVGPVATPFEHLSFADDLRLCERYFEVDKMNSGTGGYYAWSNSQTGNTRYHNIYCFRAMKRSSPTITIVGTAHGVTPTMFHSSTHIHMYHQSSSFYLTANHESHVFTADSEL